jgi:hypothetical protein
VRQVEAEEVDLAPLAADHRDRLAEVGLRLTGRMGQRHEHLAGAGAPLADVVLDDRIAAGEAVLGPQPIVDPLGRMPLLRRRRPIGRQDLVDGRGKGVGSMPKRRAASRWLSPSTWQAWRTRA